MISKGLIVSFDDAEAAGQVSVRTTENVETVLISHGENRFPVKLSDLKEAIVEIDGFIWVKKTMDSIPPPTINCDPGFAVEPQTTQYPGVNIITYPPHNINAFYETVTNVTDVPPPDSL